MTVMYHIDPFMPSTLPPFGPESVAWMLEFLPHFEAGEFANAEEHYLATGNDLPIVLELKSAVGQSGFILQFNWVEWRKKVWRAVECDEGIATSDLMTLRKLMTTWVRGDRFCGGTMAHRCSFGRVERVLRRLEELSQKGE